jgi:DNA-directed RNA polymerase subunit F
MIDKKLIEKAGDRAEAESNAIHFLTSFHRIAPERGREIVEMQLLMSHEAALHNANIRTCVLLDWEERA